MADLEDALKKLDRLTQEEARIAHAEVLRITHGIRKEVKIVDGKAEKVEDKVEEVGDKVEDIGDRVQCVDDKIRVVIDGALRLSSPWLKFLTSINDIRRQASKISGSGNKINCSTDSQRRRRNQVFVNPWPRYCSQLTFKITLREPVDAAPKILALSCRSLHKSQHCTKGSTQRDYGVALSRQDHYRMEVYWFPIVDPRKTCVSVISFRASAF
jgi:hypothetical protein